MSPRRPPARGAAPVVVVGATGGIGSGIVAALLEAGRPVIAVARDPGRLSALAGRFDDPALAVLPGSIASDADGAALADTLRAMKRPLGGVVVAVSSPLARGRLLDEPALLTTTLHHNLLPALVATRQLLPLLAAAARNLPMLLIGGPCARNPWAGYGHLAVNAAALRMLMQVLRLETDQQPVRLQLLSIDSPVRTGRSGVCACPDWPSASEVGQRVRELLDDTGSRDPIVPFVEPRRAATTRSIAI